VDAFAVGRPRDLVAERGLPAVEHVGHAEGAEEGLLGGAGGSEDFGAGGLSQLNRGKADAAGSGVDQHAFAGLKIRRPEREIGGDEADGHGREGGRGEPGGSGYHECRIGHHLRRERTESHSGHRVAGRDAFDIRAGLQDAADQFAADLASGGNRADAHRRVDEVEAHRLDGDPDLAGFEIGSGSRLRPKRGQAGLGILGADDPVGVLRQGETRVVGAGPYQARGSTDASPVGDEGLGIGEQEFMGEFRSRRRFR